MLRSLSSNYLYAVGAAALAPALAANGSLTSLNLAGNQLCGLDFRGNGTYTADGITAIADALRVNGSLTSLDLSNNYLTDEGVSAVCEAIQSNKETKLASLNFGNTGVGPVGANALAAMVAVTGSLTSLDLSNNQLCGVTTWGGTYTAEGITAIADALRVNGSLKSLNLSNNVLCGMTRFGGTYTAEGIPAIADALRVNGALTVTNLMQNELDAESAKMLAEVAKQKDISLCGIQRDQTTAYFSRQGLKPPDAILLASDLSQAGVTGSLTELSIYGNRVGDEGVRAICEAIQSNKETKLASLNFGNTGVGPVGANALAAMVAVTGALTEME